MKIKKLLIRNFLSHSNTDITFDNVGATLILGRKDGKFDDSNGIGKSNIIYAIRYCLTGDLPPDCTMEKIVRDDQTTAMVQIDFEVDGTSYILTRTRNNKTNKSEIQFDLLLPNGEIKKLTGKINAETEAEYRKISKIDSKIFDNTVYLPQKSFASLLTATPTERKKIFKEILQISLYSKFEKLAQKKQSIVAKEIDRLKIISESITHPQEMLIELEKNIKHHSDQIESIKNNISLLQNEKNKTENEQTELIKKIDAFKSDQIKAKELVGKISSANNALNKINDSINSDSKTLNESENTLKKCKVDLDIALSDLKAYKNSVKIDETLLLTDLEKQRINQANGRAWVAKTELQVKELSKPITTADVCQDCLQSVPHQHRVTAQKERSLSLSKAQEDLISFKQKLVKVADKILSIENNIKNQKQLTNNINLNEKKVENVTLQISALEKSTQSVKNLIETNKQRIKELQITILSDKNELQSLPSDLDTLVSAKISADSLKNKIDAELEQNVKQQHVVTVLLGEISGKLQSKKDDAIKLNELKEKLSLLEFENKIRIREVEAFDSKGIPTMIINNVLDDIQIETNQILSIIRPELEMSWQVAKIKDEKIDDTLMINFRLEARDRVVGQLSVGQRASASIALMIACKKVIQDRLKIHVDLLCLDEADADWDAISSDRFVDLIRSLQDKYLILITTHNDRMKSKFSSAIIVENNGQGSVGKLESI